MYRKGLIMYKKNFIVALLWIYTAQSKQFSSTDTTLLITRMSTYVAEEMRMLNIEIAEEDIIHAAKEAIREYTALLTCKAKQDKYDESHNLDDKIILSNVTSIMMNALLMIINNKDKEKLAAGGCNIIQGLSNIIKETTKQIILDMTEEN